jgi:hypothetical protein
VTDVAPYSQAIVAANRTCLSERKPIEYSRQQLDAPIGDCKGFVAPSMARPVLTASRPSQTIATTGPAAMYLINPGKNDFPFRSA